MSAAPAPSARLVRAVAAERELLTRHRARLASEAAELRAALARIEQGLAVIDERRRLLDRLATPSDVGDAPGLAHVEADPAYAGTAPGDGAPAAAHATAPVAYTATRGPASLADGRVTRADGRSTPATGRATSDDGAATPAEGRRTPATGRATPDAGAATPAEGWRTLAEERRTPAEEPRTPAAGRRTPPLRGPAIRHVAVAALIENGHQALHYRDWFALVREQGHEIAGKDPLAVFLTQLSRSPALRRGDRPGVYELDRQAPSRLRAELTELHERLRELTSATGENATGELAQVRGRRTRLTREIARVERALEEVLRVLPRAVRAA
jgi:hypothetical protein